MQYYNEMSINFLSKSENESLARVVVAAFVSQLDPTIDELDDIKTAVSEAVTNSIIHGYNNDLGYIHLSCKIEDTKVYIEIKDTGRGIDDIEKAKEPLYTSRPELERSGMGFTVMESFMDDIEVYSIPNNGTTISMYKNISNG